VARRNSNGLTDKWQIAIDEWIVNGRNGRLAYKKAYPKAKDNTCETQFSELLKKPEVAKYLLKVTEAATEQTQIDAAWVLTRISEMIDSDPLDIFDAVTGCYKPIEQWPIIWRRMLSAADVQEIYDGQGKDRKKVGEIVKYKFIDKLKAYEMIGKHVDVQAFKDRIEVTNTTTLADKMKAARNRVKS